MNINNTLEELREELEDCNWLMTNCNYGCGYNAAYETAIELRKLIESKEIEQ